MLKQVNDFVVHPFGGDPIIDDGRVRVWITNLDEYPLEVAPLSWLSTSEHAKAAHLKNPIDRQRYLASHIFTRRALSNVTDIAPRSLELLVDRCGKPCLSFPEISGCLPSEGLLGFNVSHSENFFCIATVLGCDVGVDIEVVNSGLDILAISRACLDQVDVDLVRCSPFRERNLLFHRLWTRREAFAKMLGHGVNSNHVHLAPAPRWSLRSLELTLDEKQIVGSLAIAAPATSSANDF
jgi:4'-phosphopantetheinyl transferase